MEMIKVAMDDDAFDEAVHGTIEGSPSLSESGDLAIYVKKRALQSGKAGAVVTFGVTLPNGQKHRAQAVTTVTNLLNVLTIIKEWRDGGHLDEPR